jgi:hypothetical protein
LNDAETEFLREYYDTVERISWIQRKTASETEKRTENWASEFQETTMKSERERSVQKV